MSANRGGRGDNPVSPEELIILQRRKTVADLYLHGKTQWQIAHALQCGQATVSRDLSAIRLEWKHTARMDFGKRQDQELAKIDRLEIEYLEAWQRSKQNAERTISKMRRGGGSSENAVGPLQGLETSKIEEGQSGDPRFLEGVRWCIAKRLEIILPPKTIKHAHGGDAEAPPIRQRTEVSFIEVTGGHDDSDSHSSEPAPSPAAG